MPHARLYSPDLGAPYQGHGGPHFRSRFRSLAVRKASGGLGEQLKPRVAHPRSAWDVALTGRSAIIAQETTDRRANEFLAAAKGPFLDRSVQGLSELGVQDELHPRWHVTKSTCPPRMPAGGRWRRWREGVLDAQADRAS